jgi:predicted unusual protein kinase regulating ubiquinone biosynthesis (AarF/ABC1/UbiB family)
MAFSDQHLKTLGDHFPADLVEELNKLHEKVFPTKKVAADKSDDDAQ